MRTLVKPIPEPKFLIPSDLPLSFVAPSEVRKKDGLESTNVVKTDNLGLLISRYIPHQVIQNGSKDAIFEINKSGKKVEYLKLRSLWFEHLPDNFTGANHQLSHLITRLYERWLAMTEGASRFRMVARSRLIVGLGGKGALDFGITLNRITGLPYIPGSALKGLCRNYQLLKIAEKRGISPLPNSQIEQEDNDRNKNKTALDRLEATLTDERFTDDDAVMFRRMFGTQNVAGELLFFDAILCPLEEQQPIIELDVMTPHFSKYYVELENREPPHDSHDPIPVTFITIPTGTIFAFAIGHRCGVKDNLLADATAILQEALAQIGIGAKTAAGYGIFESAQPIKTQLEIGDEIRGEIFDTSNGIWFTPDEKYTFGKEYEAQIPPDKVQRQRREGDMERARVIEIRGGDPIYIICEQVVKERKQ